MSEYFIGLDIGTESVGWAVTDTEYKIQKRHGKALWGVRMFPEALKAEERRGFRTGRRRLERRNQRIALLREIFSEEIAKADPAFFIRMDESKFDEDDKYTDASGNPLGRYTLFADKSYCDKDFHKEFHTIYHLRYALMTQDRAFDVRLVYLAIHHILKKRGHFLFADMDLDAITFEACFKELNEYLREEYEIAFALQDAEGFKNTLKSREMNTTAKKSALRKCAGVGKESEMLTAVIDLLAGATVKASRLLGLELDGESDVSLCFKKDLENEEAKLADAVGESMALVYAVKRIYDWAVLEDLRGGCGSISEAKVKLYKRHKEELRALKDLFNADKKLKKEFFRKDGENNYAAYSGHNASKKCSYEDFCAFAKKKIAALIPSLDEAGKVKAEEILKKIENETYLLKQTAKSNGTIPHQLHEQELIVILENASKYLPFLNETDASGLSRKEQILSIFRFRVPYYIGPLNKNSPHSWLERTEEVIRPWNFDKVVDIYASAEKFITKMTATCTYLSEPVLPKDSLLYSKFVVLNMINKIRVNGHEISADTKKRIFNECILPQGRANYSLVNKYMQSVGLMQKGDELTGIDKEFKATLTGYKVFEKILARPDTFDMVEDIIMHVVCYGEDRRLLEGWLKNTYAHILSEAEIACILQSRGRFSGWGNLSKTLLVGIEHKDAETEEVCTLMDKMWNTNHNLMELLSDNYRFMEEIRKFREEKLGGKKITLEEHLKDSYASPGIRRAIHQTMHIISEIESIMGAKPKRVFVEVTRGESEKKERTVSRKAKLDALYASCKKDAEDVFKELQAMDDARLRSAKLYLYFTQKGRCMYSEERIPLEELGTNYDIDHIYPQKLVKDDSFDNRVLVKKELNYAKSDKFPIAENIREGRKDFWKMLRAKDLISEEKYRRLTRNTPFTDNELSGFIARQLVETGQACKIVTELLKRRYQDNRVVYVKAKHVSDFRQDQRILPDGTQLMAGENKNLQAVQDPVFVKCRDVNDFHHAKDAYLNIVVGNVYHVKFTANPYSFIQSRKEYSLNCMFTRNVERNGECAWRKGDEGSIQTVRQMMRKNNILFTRYAYEAKGGLFKQTIMPKGTGEAAVKTGDERMSIEKFGGYTKRTGAYFILVEHTEKKKRVRSIETVLLIDKEKFEKNAEAYLAENMGLKEPRVLIPKIKIDSLISYNGFRMHVSGRTGDRIIHKNANQLVLNPEQAGYIKKIGKYLERCRAERNDAEITVFDGITEDGNITLYGLLLNKLHSKPYCEKLATAAKTVEENREKFGSLSVPNQCRVLMQILNMFNTTAASADLKLLCGKLGIGILRISKSLDNYEGQSVKLIHQSFTGVFEKEIDLLGDEL